MQPAVWYWWFRDGPAEHPSVREPELLHIRDGRIAVVRTGHSGMWNSSILLLCLMYFTQTYGFYFFITWLPPIWKNKKGSHPPNSA